MARVSFLPWAFLKRRLHAAGLEALEAGAGGNLAVGVLGRQPDFQVVGLGGEKPMSPEHSTILRYGSSSFCRMASAWPVSSSGHPRLFGLLDADQLDLVELVLADHAAGVLAVAAGFGAEARRGQRTLSGSASSGTISSRTMLVTGTGGRDQVELAAVGLGTENRSSSNLGSWYGAEHAGGVDHIRRVELGVAVLGGCGCRA